MSTILEPPNSPYLPERRYPLFDFAYCPNFSEMLMQLAKKAAPEPWDFRNRSNLEQPLPILYRYIHHTFKRIKEESDSPPDKGGPTKIAISGDYACFNTGLFSEHYEQIYALFSKNRMLGRQEWYMVGFFKESERDLNRFFPLPVRAEYLSNISDLVYDYRLDIRAHMDHIFDEQDNILRFPEKYHGNEHRTALITAFSGALAVVKKRVAANYKLAVPQYYEGQVQLLLPMCLDGDNPDVALVIYRDNQVYQAKTCLTLDMAYNNSRLLAKPQSDWLQP